MPEFGEPVGEVAARFRGRLVGRIENERWRLGREHDCRHRCTPPAWTAADLERDLNESGDACLEVASAANIVAIRDSKDPGGPELIMNSADFGSFVEVLKKL